MPDFQYTTVPGKLSALLDKVRTVGVPAKVTNQWLKAIGFTSSNDTSLATILKAIGFADQSGTPTDHWRNYRGAKAKAVLAHALRESYRPLFEVYPDAWRRSDSELESFFSTRSNAGKQAISKTVSTFKNLAVLADFEDSSPGPQHHQSNGTDGVGHAGAHITGPSNKVVPPTHHPMHPALHIDIQIHISSDATAQQIDQIFASMAKHLYEKSNG